MILFIGIYEFKKFAAKSRYNSLKKHLMKMHIWFTKKTFSNKIQNLLVLDFIFTWFAFRTHHSVGFSRPSLTVSKYAGIVTSNISL